MIPLPWKLGALAAAVVAALGLGTLVHHHVYQQGWAARDAIAKQQDAIAAAHYADEVRQAKDATAAIQAQADRDAQAYQLERDHHEKDIAQHVAAALAGVERLRVPVAGCTVRDDAPHAGASTPSDVGDEAGAYVMPGAAADILRIAGEQGQLVRDYNELLERFDACRAVANAP